MEPYTLYHGDCFEYLRGLPDASVDLVLTDPPYGITGCQWDIVPDISRFWREAWRVLKPNGAAVIFGTVKSGLDWIMASRKEFRYDLVWEKTKAACFVNVNRRPLAIHEMIYVFYRSHPTFNPQKYKPEGASDFEKKVLEPENRVRFFSGGNVGSYTRIVTNERFYKSVLKFSNGGKYISDSIHQTKKPITLMEHIIKMYTSPGETVLDPFMGSGSTGVACIQTGRKFIGCELDTGFFDIAQKRIQNAVDNYQHTLFEV